MGDDVSALGNFKGVMLCNRPAQIPGSLQTIVGPTATSGPTRPAFVSAVVPDTVLGLPPVKVTRVNHPELPPKEADVTWRHKKWLAAFSDARRTVQESMERRMKEQQERAKRFAERSQAMRDAIRGVRAEGEQTDRATKAQKFEAALGLSARPQFVPTEYVDVSQQFPAGAPISAQRQKEPAAPPPPISLSSTNVAAATPAPAASPAAKPKKKPAAAKPGWARTEAEDDDFLDVEADSLIDFANNLDYDRYIDDLEVREALKFVQQRVAGLEETQAQREARDAQQRKLIEAGELEEVWVVDESAPPNAETGEPTLKKIVRRVKRAQKAALNLTDAGGTEEWDVSTATEGMEQSERDRQAQADALSRTVLDSNRNMRAVHSSASVRAIMDNQAKEAANAASTLRRNQAAAAAQQQQQQQQSSLSSIPEPLPPPVITTIYERDQKAHAINPSNLPFLYRHPGI